MNVEEFCVGLAELGLSQQQQALAALWFLDRAEPGSARNAGQLSRLLHDSGLATPHSTRLGESLARSGHVLKVGDRYKIKPTSRSTLEKMVASILIPAAPVADQANGFLPEAVWIGTFSYIEKIARQVNGCYEFGFYDGASVLARRIVETLLIECYEKLGIENKIKKSDGNYPMLSDLIVGAVNHGHLSLGRETKKVLNEIKTLGDRSAHNRRYTAEKPDLDSIRSGVRLAVDELLHIAGRK